MAFATRFSRLSLAGALALAAACSDPGSPTPATAYHVAWPADSLVLRLGHTTEVILAVAHGDTALLPTGATVVSSDTAVATIIGTTITSHNAGLARIVGSYNGAADTLRVIVPARQPIALRFSVESLVVAVGGQIALKPLITLLDVDSTIIPSTEYTCAFQVPGPDLSVVAQMLEGVASGRALLRAQCLGYADSLRAISYRGFSGTATVFRFNNGTGGPFPVDVSGNYAVIGRPAPGTIQRINLSTGVGDLPIQVDSSPADIALTPDGSTAYVATSTSRSVAVVDILTRTVTARYPVPASYGAPNRLRLVGDRLVVATANGALHVLDAATGALDTTFVAVVWFGPQDLWVDGSIVTVIEENRAARVLDIAARQTVRSLLFPAASYTYGIAYRGDTTFAASLNGVEVDGPTGRIGLILPGMYTSDVELSPDGHHLYVAGLFGGDPGLALNVVDWKAQYVVARYYLGNNLWKGTLRERPDGTVVLAGSEGLLVLRPQ